MAVSNPDLASFDKPQRKDLDKCVHCGLCLNSCPTYRELGIEMDSPRGRIYQMNQVSQGLAQIGPSYIEHLELCLACRGCETACPSGVQYGRLIEAARAEIETKVKRPWHVEAIRNFVFQRLLPSPTLLRIAAAGLWVYQKLGLQAVARATGIVRLFGTRAEQLERLSPDAEFPTFFAQYGKTFPPDGPKRYRVAMLGGCMANVSFARLHEATVRVLQKNGCEVVVPADQTCCGALHVHAGRRDDARALARQNIDALLKGNYDAIITNTSGCGSTLKEYHDLFEHDSTLGAAASKFSHLVKDINEFLASIELNPRLGAIHRTVTYQDSCHLAHGQKIKAPPRKLLRAIPGLTFKEMALSDVCCGSAGIYNVMQTEMSMAVLAKKMENVNRTGADTIVTANPGCIIQLRTGACLHGKGQPVKHVVEMLDESYSSYRA